MKYLNIIISLLLILFLTTFSACTGDGGSASDLDSIDPTPSFTPGEDDDLADLYINTFADNGIDITTDPSYIDFNALHGSIEKDDELSEPFTITNNSGETRTFEFQIYSVSSGYAILDEDGVNQGGYTQIEVPNGESITFNLQFNAWLFGSHTSYITITADIEGHIQFPMRAVVNGAADFKVIPTGYACADEDTPTVTELDFYKVATGQTKTLGIKVCNTGGEDISVYSAEIEAGDNVVNSIAMESNAYEDFIWQVSDEIDATFAFGLTPTTEGSFNSPTYTNYPGSVNDPAVTYNVSVHHTGDAVVDLLVAAGKLLRLDVNFAPDLNQEAAASTLYNPEPFNATMSLNTSLGTIQIPLLGASSGIEPVLEMHYRFSDEENWRKIDLTADSPALDFGNVDLFLDWVSNNASITEIMITNTGSGDKTLDFYGGTIKGFYEYYWDDEDTPLTFPLTLAAGESKTFKIRYLPQTTIDLNDNFEANWNFGQFYFEHTGGNGPNGKIVLVGEQDAGFAVELYYGGARLNHEYNEDQYKNLCAFPTDPDSEKKTRTFRVINNSKTDRLEVNWSVSYSPSDITITSAENGSFEVPPGTEGEFKFNIVANPDKLGEFVGGTLNVSTNYPDKEAEYAALLTDLPYTRDFAVPFKAAVNETGDSTRCGGGVLGDEDSIDVTFVVDRITMTLTSLIESNRNPPAFRFHFPLEINKEKGSVRLKNQLNFTYDKDDEKFSYIRQIRSYVHQATNIRGCFTVPANPYRLEFQKGSWTGEGLDCSDDGIGTLKFSNTHAKDFNEFGEADSTMTIDSDTVCLDNNGGETYTDADGTEWVVFYHDFVKFNSCDIEYYGKVSTIAFRPNEEELFDVYKRAEEYPNESETYYEQVYGAFKFDSYIAFVQESSCGGITYPAGTLLDDPDAVREFYYCKSGESDSKRAHGFLDECSYFHFTIDEGVVPEDADSDNPDYDSWTGYGIYEPHVDDFGTLHSTKYDMTIFNVHLRAFVLGGGDRVKFFSHPGHLLYSDLYSTITTKRVAEESSAEDGTWQDRIAVQTRQHFDKDQIFLEHGNPVDINDYWVKDDVTAEFSNVIDNAGVQEAGRDYGGYGKGNFRFMEGADDKIIFAGWPINYDENNLLVMVMLGSFVGKGNTAPSFAKADSATGKGKSLYFTFHGCLVAGEPDESVGCFDYYRDNKTMLDDPTKSVIDEYVEHGILPDGYVSDAAECLQLEDAGFTDRDDYIYMSCINFKITDLDYDRYTNYYDRTNRFEYDDNSYYNSDVCGYGM